MEGRLNSPDRRPRAAPPPIASPVRRDAPRRCAEAADRLVARELADGFDGLEDDVVARVAPDDLVEGGQNGRRANFSQGVGHFGLNAERREARRDRLIRGVERIVSLLDRGRGPIAVEGSNHESIIMYDRFARQVSEGIMSVVDGAD